MSLRTFFKSPAARRLRVAFRWVRITIWFLIFLVVAAVAYLHLVGLPNFLKQELLDRLSERGFELQFSSARLGWGPDVLVENASFHRSDHPLSPRLSAERTQIHLNPERLLRRRVAVESLLIANGRLELPFSLATGDYLSVNNVFLDIALLPNDTIRLKTGHATFHGIDIALEGTITNYMASRDIYVWPAGASTNAVPAATRTENETLRQLAVALDKIHFPSPPKINLKLTADARDPDTLQTEVKIEADGAQSPWGEFTGLTVEASCSRPIHSGSAPFVKARLVAGTVQTPEAHGKNIYLSAELSRLAGTNLQTAVIFAADDLEGHLPGMPPADQLKAASLDWNGRLDWQSAPWEFIGGAGKLRMNQFGTPWGSTDSANVTVSAARTNGAPTADASWGFWEKLNHWAFDGKAELVKAEAAKIRWDRLSLGGSWRGPELVLTNFAATLYGGQVAGRAELDVASRELKTSAHFDVDAHSLAHLLPPAVRDQLEKITWQRPPQVAVDGRAVLPSWTKRSTNWLSELLPSLQGTGDFSIGPVSREGISADSIQTRFAYTNGVWNIPRLHLVRPGADVLVDFTGGHGTPDYLFIIDTKLNPAAIRPVLPEKAQPWVDQVSFTDDQPAEIHAEAWGRWHEPESLAVRAQVAATNFTARDEKVDSLAAGIYYSNLVLQVNDLHLSKDVGEATVPLAGMDFTGKKISFSNAVSTMDPRIVNRLLGAHTPAWLRVIGFEIPPTIHASGSCVIGDEAQTDLHFNVTGQNFRYTHLLADTASGQVDWVGRHVALTNVQGSLYNGTARGWGVFDYVPGGETHFRGQTIVAGVELPLVLREWITKSNSVEGVLNSEITITDGSSRDRHSWTGYGHLAVNHALLWNIKLFGVFSPVLNAIVPGSGNSRAYQASANFVITNAMVVTDNLEIRSTDFRLLYRGSLNTEKQLDAIVEAHLLRDTPLFGRLFSLAFSPFTKLFEYKISGTLDAPIHRPRYIPKTLSLFLEPFHKKTPMPPTTPTEPDDKNPPGQPAGSPKN